MGDIDSPDRPVAVSVGVLGCSDGSTTSRKGISMLAFPMRRSRATCQRAAVCLLLWSMRCIASPLPTDYVTEMVAGWLATTDSPLGTPMGDEIESCETYRDAAGTPLYHVVNLKPDGYVVTPASNGIEPIIAFVASGRYEAVPSNPLFMLVEADVRRRMERVRGLGSSQDVGVAPDALSTNVVHSPAQSAKLKWEDLVRRGRGDSNYHIDDGHGVRSLDDERVRLSLPAGISGAFRGRSSSRAITITRHLMRQAHSRTTSVDARPLHLPKLCAILSFLGATLVQNPTQFSSMVPAQIET